MRWPKQQPSVEIVLEAKPILRIQTPEGTQDWELRPQQLILLASQAMKHIVALAIPIEAEPLRHGTEESS